jgi:hypothetical protein
MEGGLCFCGPFVGPLFFRHFGPRLSYIRESGDETPVVRKKSKETPQLLFFILSWPALYSFQLLGVRGYP